MTNLILVRRHTMTVCECICKVTFPASLTILAALFQSYSLRRFTCNYDNCETLDCSSLQFLTLNFLWWTLLLAKNMWEYFVEKLSSLSLQDNRRCQLNMYDDGKFKNFFNSTSSADIAIMALSIPFLSWMHLLLFLVN